MFVVVVSSGVHRQLKVLIELTPRHNETLMNMLLPHDNTQAWGPLGQSLA